MWTKLRKTCLQLAMKKTSNKNSRKIGSGTNFQVSYPNHIMMPYQIVSRDPFTKLSVCASFLCSEATFYCGAGDSC